MAIWMKPPHRVRKREKSIEAQAVLDKLQAYLDGNMEVPVEMLCGFWKDQQDAITYQEIREAVKAGMLDEATFQEWARDYSILVARKLEPVWEKAMAAGAACQTLISGMSFTFSTQTPGVARWISQRGAAFVTACSEEQKKAISSLLAQKVVESHTVDELARLIRPCIGLTDGQSKATLRYYDNIAASLRENHPRMKPERIQQKAADAAMKYAERQHRQRAVTIAQTEMAFAYNRGADEGIRQARAQNLIGAVEKRWSTSGDENVCSTCEALDGIQIGMEGGFGFTRRELFEGQDLLPPAHPRCACAVMYIEVEEQSSVAESPMRTGDDWIDGSIEDYDNSLINTNGDETMSARLLMSHDEVRYERDENAGTVFLYNPERDVILYNPHAKNANDYDKRFALTHENAHRVDCLFLHSWENERFLRAMDNAESLIMTNLDAVERLLQNSIYGEDFAFNDLISSLTRGKANDMLFIGHSEEYLSSDYLRSLEVFANMTCIDMSGSAIRKEFDGILKELYEAYKEVVAWGSLV
ncbi:phage minor head protein [Lachnospiraceae bacterium 46-15]